MEEVEGGSRVRPRWWGEGGESEGGIISGAMKGTT